MSTDEVNERGKVLFAVNGSLMRGLELNGNLLRAGGRFVREAKTDGHYRLWTIDDRHPAMIRSLSGGSEIDLEIWELPVEGLVSVLREEPPGLCVGRVILSDGGSVLGVLGEPYILENQKEITEWGGWRMYLARYIS